MKKHIIIVALLLAAGKGFCQVNDPDAFNNNDLLAIEEQLPKSPEAASLGEYGALRATPYNGKANITVPMHSINFEGLQIPLSLSYDTGGVRLSQEAGMIGLNWNFSANYGVTRQIFGISDFGSRVGSSFDSGKTNGYIFNNINIATAEGGTQPGHSYDQIYDVHYSLSLFSTEGSEPSFLDTQSDLFTLNTFDNSYKFILKKKGTTNIVDTHVFNNNNAQITFNLDDLTFTLVDEKGFTYSYAITEISTNMATIQNNGSTPPGSEVAAYQYLFSGENAAVTNAYSLPTTWGLTRVVSPNGRSIDFKYDKPGLYLTFPQYSFNNRGNDHESFPWSEFRTRNLERTGHNVSFAVIEKDYLTEISGDFGKVIFGYGNRLDLSTGSTLNTLSEGMFGPNLITTKFNIIRSCHGLPDCTQGTGLLPTKMENFYVENGAGRRIIDVSFQQSYFNNDDVNNAVPERFLRLKLDGVTVNDRQHTFSYIEPNNMAAKDSDGVDFWGFANGREDINEGKVPQIGRFVTSRFGWNSSSGYVSALGQQYIIYYGADRSAHFNFGKRGLLNGIVYPTGGATEFTYEPHDIVLARPNKFQVLETWPQEASFSSGYRWTNMLNEGSFDNTYHYLKHSKDPNFNYVEMEVPQNQGNEIELEFRLNQTFNVDFPSSVEVSAALRVETGLDGLAYWGNEVLLAVQEVNTREEYPLIYYKDAPNQLTGDPLSVTNSTQIPVGVYRLVRKSITVPDGNYQDYPPQPAISINNPILKLFTFETLDDAATVLERFEIGGARIKTMINKNIDGAFINGTAYDYNFTDGFEGLSSSGKLMDELIFYQKTNGFYSYNTRYSESYSHVSNNVVGGQPSAQGSHIGYSNVREYQTDAFGNNLGHIERQYQNTENEYFTDSFTLPYAFGSSQGNGDPYIKLFGFITTKWVCSGLDLGNNCSGNTQWQYSFYGNATIENTKILGLPLRLSFNHSNGNVLEERVYDRNGILKRKTENQYTLLNGNLPNYYFSSFKNFPIYSEKQDADGVTIGIQNVQTTVSPRFDPGNIITLNTRQEAVMPWGMNHSTYYAYTFPQHYGQISKLFSSNTINYESGHEIATQNLSTYDQTTHFLRENRVIDSRQRTYKSITYYPNDGEVSDQTGIQNLIAENQLSIPVLTENYVEDRLLTTQKTDFANDNDTFNNTLPIKVSSLKGTAGASNAFEPRFEYERYGRFGTILQAKKEDGTPVSYIWGYNEEHIIAKIDNATYNQLGSLASAIRAASLSDNDRTIDLINGDGTKNYIGNEGVLRDLSDQLRQSLPHAMITSYTYDPMIGVTSITDPKGYTTFYEYDTQNRLKHIKDQDGNLVQDMAYKYSDGRFNGSFSESPYTSPDAGGNVQIDRPISVRIAYGNSGATFQTFNANVSGGDGQVFTYRWYLGIGASATQFETNSVSNTETYTMDVGCDQIKYVKVVVTNGNSEASAKKVNGNYPCRDDQNPGNFE
ncbi:MAG: RHS repeat domain-containing protein [Bacteroidota bacterium]